MYNILGLLLVRPSHSFLLNTLLFVGAYQTCTMELWSWCVATLTLLSMKLGKICVSYKVFWHCREWGNCWAAQHPVGNDDILHLTSTRKARISYEPNVLNQISKSCQSLISSKSYLDLTLSELRVTATLFLQASPWDSLRVGFVFKLIQVAQNVHEHTTEFAWWYAGASRWRVCYQRGLHRLFAKELYYRWLDKSLKPDCLYR